MIRWPLFALLLIAATNLYGADEPGTEFLHRYPEMLGELENWNAGKIEWSKESFSDLYHSEVDRLMVGKPADWGSSRLKVWDSLPRTLSRERALSDAGMVMLTSYYAENSAKFLKSAEESRRQKVLQCKLYLILAKGQQHAVESKHETIEPSDLFVGLRDAWTSLWPICPEK